MLFFSVILLTTMMNAFVSHECVWFSVLVCVCFMNGADLTMKTNFYNLAETTLLHICKCFVFLSVVFELLIATFQVFLFNSVGCFVRSLITTKFTLQITDENISDLHATLKQKQDSMSSEMFALALLPPSSLLLLSL